ncbi:MAG: TIGR03915 family putative DNA repair protein [Lachnospiraceae bacterium]
MKTVYVCSDTVLGIFSAVYDAWKAKYTEEECGIAVRGFLEQELFCEYEEVDETEEKVAAVERLIYRHLGMQAYHDIYYAILSDDPKKGDAVLGTMLAAKSLSDSKKIMDHLSHPKVQRVFELSRAVSNEAHYMIEFIRFRELENGVLYSPITPKAQVLTCIASHFEDRFPLENWMIHDKTHQMYVIHEARKRWVLVQEEISGYQKDNKSSGEDMFSKVTEKEMEYERLWKSFCDTIAIKERYNPKCQRGHLPLRFRPNMVEFL